MTSLWLLLFLPSVPGISAQNLSVFQDESHNVVEGGKVTLGCHYSSAEETQIGHFSWFYYPPYAQDRIEVSNKMDHFSGRFFTTTLTDFFADKKADITIHNVQHYDAGTYVCEVELFAVGNGRGNGTLLKVVQGISAQNLRVFQDKSHDAVEGSKVTLGCHYSSAEETQIGHFSWFYYPPYAQDRIEVSNKTDRFSGRFFTTTLTAFFADKKADITIHNVRHYDTGTYVCEVELFAVGNGRGNGTLLKVVQGATTAPKETQPTENSAVQIPMSFILQSARTIGVLLLFGLAVLLIMRHYAKKYPEPRSPAIPAANVPSAGTHCLAPAPDLGSESPLTLYIA